MAFFCAVNRKLGSDMGDSVTGGGLHGKDLSKADITLNVYAWLKAQRTGLPVKYTVYPEKCGDVSDKPDALTVATCVRTPWDVD